MDLASFSLVKWYTDCATDAGEAVILYCAEVSWRGVHAQVGSLLTKSGDGAANTRSSLGRYVLTSNPRAIEVEHPRLKVRGTWESDSPPFQSTLYENAKEAVMWSCVQPRSRAKVRIGDREFAGLGYAECLTLTMPPWQLPMRELRWGRFVSAERTLAWVDWQGPYSTSVAFLDSQRCALRSVSETHVVAGEAELWIAPGEPLRSGRLGSTILRGASGLRKLFPNSMFNVVEHKWLSRGRLNIAGRESAGWVIHEVVHWAL